MLESTPIDQPSPPIGGRAPPQVSPPLPYANGIEHLRHCLYRVDLLLLRMLELRPTRSATDHVSFAAITDAEIEALLMQPCAAATPTLDERIRCLDEEIRARTMASSMSGVWLPLIELAGIFALTEIEMVALIACCAPEIDRKYERVYGYLHDDMSRKLPSVGLLLELLSAVDEDLTQRYRPFDRQAALFRYRLLQLSAADGMQPLAARLVSVDERILAHLLGSRRIDARINECLAPATGPAPLSASQMTLRDTIATTLSAQMQHAGVRRKPLVYLHGSLATAADDVVHAAAAMAGLAVLQANATQLATSPAGFSESLFLFLRECLLGQAAAYVSGMDCVLVEDQSQSHWMALIRLLTELGGITFLSGERPWIWGIPPAPLLLLPLAVEPADFAEQIAMWRQLTRGIAGMSDTQLHEIASTHPMAPAEIAATVELARSLATLRGTRSELASTDVQQACRTRARSGLSGIARRVEPKYCWEDIVLPAAALEQLQAICSQAKRRSLVFGDWGFERKLSLGKGLNALFAGPPGTGKTMAAEVIASDLKLELYKIDLSQVVSKYVGETEKNLSRVFEGAARAHAILLFDEADALLGKRSAVKDAHDRYANTEIAYLLQKMEEYEGITILTTNLRQNMDDAFTRRMRFIVEFPFPDDADRLRIWQRVWPQEVPLAGDVDLARLTRLHRLSGGSIRNVALAAAFMAAEERAPVGMQHLLHATKRELLKMGRLVNDEHGENGGRS